MIGNRQMLQAPREPHQQWEEIWVGCVDCHLQRSVSQSRYRDDTIVVELVTVS